MIITLWKEMYILFIGTVKNDDIRSSQKNQVNETQNHQTIHRKQTVFGTQTLSWPEREA